MIDGLDEIRQLEVDLTETAGLMAHKAAQAVEQTAVRTKSEWRKLAKRNPLGGRYTSTIDYTVREYGAFGQGVIEAEVGPNLDRYGGKTGRGGLMPSAGIFDDPLNQGGILRAPDRSRQRAEEFAAEELGRGVEIALRQSLAERNLDTLGGAISGVIRGSA